MSSFNKGKKARPLKRAVAMKLVRIDGRTEVEVPATMSDELARKRWKFNHQDDHQTRSNTLFKKE